MKVYHEASSDTQGSILAKGLKRTSRGEKGSSTAIINTDALLDEHRPKYLKDAGVSRDDNIYAFIGDASTLVDIQTGELTPIHSYAKKDGTALFACDVDPRQCFVSDLDTYDAVMDLVTHHGDANTIEKMAVSYWKKIVPLAEFKIGDIQRPEVMIPYDISPHHIQAI